MSTSTHREVTLRHIIDKQTFEITATSIPVAQQWEQKSPGIVRDLISPCVESCFDMFAGGAKDHIIIDKLEIELGEISESNFRQVVPERLRKALIKALGNYARVATSVDFAGITTESLNRPFQISQKTSVLYSFIYFLKSGLLPWWVEPSDVLWSTEWVAQLGAEDVEKIMEVGQNPVAEQRLIYQYDDDFLSALVAGPTGLLQAEIINIWLALSQKEVDVSRQQLRKLRQEFWQFWIGVAANKASASTIIDAFTAFIFEDEIKRKIITSVLHSELLKSIDQADGTGFIKKVLHKLGKKLSEHSETHTQSESSRSPLKVMDQSSRPAVTDRVKKVLQGAATPREISTQVDEEAGTKALHLQDTELRVHSAVSKPQQSANDIQEGMLVQDAGIVLLHPFLLELFKECELWHDGHWRQLSSSHKAVYLLAWLSSGDTDIPEYLLPLHKTLCGVPLEEPLETGFELNQTDIANCTDLLKAVVNHWTAIGRTSPDGLREGFLQRPGKLEKKKKGWLLTVEKKAQDVLLGKLPWGISIISYPWMNEQQFHVNWT